MVLKKYLYEKKVLIDENLELCLKKLEYPLVISKGMRYSVLNGGKRIRPILLLAILELLEEDELKGIPTAMAIELIHSYSLVHDDLPALDNDDYRRGELTTHKKFGEAEGILIGDSLLTYAFGVLVDKNNFLNPEQIVKLVSLTSKHSGIQGMIGGQTVDIESEGKEIDFKTLKYIHENKTGKLLRLPIEAACIIGKADKKTENVLIKYAELLGIIFQIKDDILDIEGDFEKLGKPIGSDLKSKKSTYPSIFGMEESKKILCSLGNEAKEIIKINFKNKPAQILIELIDYMVEREN
ncbi:MAG: polyprenyl synthetase family protein [Fusobacteriaceae bacterium]